MDPLILIGGKTRSWFNTLSEGVTGTLKRRKTRNNNDDDKLKIELDVCSDLLIRLIHYGYRRGNDIIDAMELSKCFTFT